MKKHGITPTTIEKTREAILNQDTILDIREGNKKAYIEEIHQKQRIAADPLIEYMNRDQIELLIKQAEKKMKKAAKELDFISAAQFRVEMLALKKKLKNY